MSAIEHIKSIMKEHDMSQSDLARRLGVTPSRISEILKGKERSITLDTALRLAKLNKGKGDLSKPSTWLKDEIVRQYHRNKKAIDRIEPL